MSRIYWIENLPQILKNQETHLHNFKVVYFEIITLKIGLSHQNIESGSFTWSRIYTATGLRCYTQQEVFKLQKI